MILVQSNSLSANIPRLNENDGEWTKSFKVLKEARALRQIEASGDETDWCSVKGQDM